MATEEMKTDHHSTYRIVVDHWCRKQSILQIGVAVIVKSIGFHQAISRRKEER